MTNQEKSLSALDVYKNINEGTYDKNPQKLFEDLQRGILADYEERGKCEYIDKILTKSVRQICLVEYSVVLDVHGFYLRGRLLTNPFQEDYLPHYTRKSLHHRDVPWKESMKMLSIDPEFLRYSSQINNYGVGLRQKRQKDSFGQDFDGIVTIPIEDRFRSGDQPDRNLGTGWQGSDRTPAGREQADQILSQARDEASRTRQGAQDEADRILDRARDEANRIHQDAQSKADQILSQARDEASQIRQDAQDEADRILDRARDEAGRILKQGEEALQDQRKRMESNARADADRLVSRYLRDYQADLRIQWDQETRADLDKDAEAIRQLNDVKQTLRDATNELKVNWRQELDKTVEEMRNIQSDLEANLRIWQSALYPRELRPIAECYAQLYLILTQNQSLTREITAREAEAGDPVPAGQEFHPETMDTLRQLNTSLLTFLKKFEKALKKLGLTVYTPLPGEAFDDVLHTSAKDEDDPYGMVVSQCLAPGVLRQSGEDPEDADPVIRAVVDLKKPEVAGGEITP